MEKEKKKKSKKSVNLIGMAEKIFFTAGKSELDPEKMEDVREEIEALGEYLGTSPLQTVHFSTIFALSLENEATVTTLAEHYGCSPMRLMTMIGDIDLLEERRLIERNDSFLSKDIYTVPVHVIESLKSHNAELIIKNDKEERKGLPVFLEKLAITFNDHKESRLTYQQLLRRTVELIHEYKEEPFVKFVNEQLSDTVSKLVFFIVLYELTNNNNRFILSTLAEYIFEDFTERFHFKQQMLEESHELLSRSMLLLRDKRRVFDASVWLSDLVVEQLAGHKISRSRDRNKDGRDDIPAPGRVIQSKNIRKKPLFFSEGLLEETDLLERLVRGDTLSEIQKKLSTSKITPGITVLMYGPPGTGKTEFAYQLARKTGRDLMMVDLSLVKSKWVGESEKEVKKIFDDYRALCRKAVLIPILFLNEADGLLTKRLDVSNSDTSALQSQNTMQNILLQEMEDFEGILLATTNLTNNLDKAFDRRFLFKIGFHEPNAEVREKIWLSRMPRLTEQQARELAGNYALSGGEIENVIKKTILQELAKTDQDLFSILNRNCLREKNYGKKESRKVGFV